MAAKGHLVMVPSSRSRLPVRPSLRERSQGQVTTSVRDVIDAKRLSSWLMDQTTFRALLHGQDNTLWTANKLEQEMTIRQFGFGQSNPTFLLIIPLHPTERTTSDTTSLLKLVLRRKPRKVAHASAHALHREFRVLQAVQRHNELNVGAQVPVPEAYVYCKDPAVAGAEFYIMSFIEGRIFTDPAMKDMSSEERTACFRDVLCVLGNLHKVDYHAVGLQGFGRESGYVVRQLDRLVAVSRRQAELSGEPVPEIEEIALKLKVYAPHCKDQTTLLHGDFKIDNLIFHPNEPKVIGVLDWELSTLGDPLCDLANLCMMYYIPTQVSTGITGIGGLDLAPLGIPTRRALVQAYCATMPSTDFGSSWDWSGFYLAFLFFKNCVIIQGVAQRAKAGVASSAVADKVAMLLPIVIGTTKDILRDNPPPLAPRPSKL